MTRPTRSYLICGTPRAGTFMLAGLLRSTGIAGRPEEYFWRDDEEVRAARWRVSAYSDYVARALDEGTTANGVFGAKLMWGYLEDVLGKLRRLHDEPSDRAVLEAVFPQPRFLWIRREDVVAQAISWSKAIRTGVWYVEHHGRPTSEPAFDRDEIAALAAEAATHAEAWRTWFDEQDIEPFELTYEQLEAAPVELTRRVLQYLGLPAESVEIRQLTTRQRDAVNTEWRRRYDGGPVA